MEPVAPGKPGPPGKPAGPGLPDGPAGPVAPVAPSPPGKPAGPAEPVPPGAPGEPEITNRSNSSLEKTVHHLSRIVKQKLQILSDVLLSASSSLSPSSSFNCYISVYNNELTELR